MFHDEKRKRYSRNRCLRLFFLYDRYLLGNTIMINEKSALFLYECQCQCRSWRNTVHLFIYLFIYTWNQLINKTVYTRDIKRKRHRSVCAAYILVNGEKECIQYFLENVSTTYYSLAIATSSKSSRRSGQARWPTMLRWRQRRISSCWRVGL